MPGFFDEWRLLEGAQTWMQARGYELVDALGPEDMNQGLHAYAGPLVAVRVVADRDQWEIEASPDGHECDPRRSEGWFNLEAWSLCLGAAVRFYSDTGEPTEGSGLRPQLDYLREHLAAIEAACAAGTLDATRACLLAAPVTLSRFPPNGANGG